jgi:hypothetical protein
VLQSVHSMTLIAHAQALEHAAWQSVFVLSLVSSCKRTEGHACIAAQASSASSCLHELLFTIIATANDNATACVW